MRPDAGTAAIQFIGNSTSNIAGGATTRAFNNITVPIGWQYRVVGSNLNTRVITAWNELS